MQTPKASPLPIPDAPARLLPPWEAVRALQRTAAAHSLPAYVVGGFVRDRLLGRELRRTRNVSPQQGMEEEPGEQHYFDAELDVMVVGSGIPFAKALALELPRAEGERKPKLSVFQRFGTAHLMHRNKSIEIVGARKESYSPDSRNPSVEEGTFDEDMARRDFTINALAVELWPQPGTLRDPFNGVADMHARILRTPLEPERTFIDDPLRMMRAVRFATELAPWGFSIHPETADAIKAHVKRLDIVSPERITEEINKILLSPTPSIGFYLMEKLGILQLILPELLKLKGAEFVDGIGHKDNFSHTLQVLDNLADTTVDDEGFPTAGALWLRWAALLHDIAKPQTKRFEQGIGWTFHGHEELGARMVHGIFKKLRLPLNDKKKRVERLVRLHLRPIALTNEAVTDSAVRRLMVDAADDLDGLMKLCRADITSRNPMKVKKFLRRFDEVERKIGSVNERDWLRNFQPVVNGLQIMERFALGPSPSVGILKDGLKDVVLDGAIVNEWDTAWDWLEAKALEIGLPIPETPRPAQPPPAPLEEPEDAAPATKTAPKPAPTKAQNAKPPRKKAKLAQSPPPAKPAD